jgi:hypothetical protein
MDAYPRLHFQNHGDADWLGIVFAFERPSHAGKRRSFV